MPQLPLLRLTCRRAFLRFSRMQTTSISCSQSAELSVACDARDGSVPLSACFRVSPLCSVIKASSTWIFCRLSSMSRTSYLPLHLTPCGGRSGLQYVVPGLCEPCCFSPFGRVSQSSKPTAHTYFALC